MTRGQGIFASLFFGAVMFLVSITSGSIPMFIIFCTPIALIPLLAFYYLLVYLINGFTPTGRNTRE